MIDPYLELQYDAQGWAGNFEECLAEHRRLSASARQVAGFRSGVRYGPRPEEVLDVIWPRLPSGPMVLFIHGGYWRGSSREDVTLLAPALLEQGWGAAFCDYSLAPAAPMILMVDQVRRALGWLRRHSAGNGADPDRIVVSGHSAGGHLTAATVTGTSPDPASPGWLPRGVVPVSGLFDLRPLLQTKVNGWLQLDGAEAARFSPLLHEPLLAPERAIVMVGATESDCFLEQSRVYAERTGARLELLADLGHFDLLFELARPEGALVNAVATLVGD